MKYYVQPQIGASWSNEILKRTYPDLAEMGHGRQLAPMVPRAGGQDDGSYANSLKLISILSALLLLLLWLLLSILIEIRIPMSIEYSKYN